ncbi:MAG: hypothetical protein LKH76_07640, partial [Acetobacter fabarum]|nr:hypothetical protein [Acetobacter fabarum]MCH4141697.1 hypothetical protein [Acetobacter fabarum]MCI1322455.1 hypothetical protein [Acetobacter fabarum]MCI1393326.1 hypothetical protein [Acetobacter fabarum]MCI1420048.1 hypothetical protein [Acetobacter fabarum]
SSEPCSEEQASNSSGRVSFSPHNQKTSSRKVRKNPVLSENQHWKGIERQVFGDIPSFLRCIATTYVGRKLTSLPIVPFPVL